MPPWLLHLLGLDSPGGTPALFWTGPAGSLGLFGAVGVWMRHRNCEVHKCWRIGRHKTAGAHKVCRKHMPGGAPSHAEVIRDHHAARQPAAGQPVTAAHADALGQATVQLSEQISGLAEVVRATLNREAP